MNGFNRKKWNEYATTPSLSPGMMLQRRNFSHLWVRCKRNKHADGHIPSFNVLNISV